MAITVTQRPSATVGGEVSKWNAARNPVLYRMTTNKYTEDNYRLEVEVYNAANVLLTVDPFLFTPNSAGALVVDISSILIANLSAEFAGDLTGSTKIFDDTNAYIKFYIKYEELWDGSAEAQVSDSGNQFFAILGAMQIPAPNGGNAGAYVTVLDGNPAAEFLTKMDVVKLWRGYPSLVSIVIGDLTVGSIYAKATDSSASASWNSKLITIDLNQLITSQDSIDSTELEVYLDDVADVLLTETLPIEIENACDNPVLLVARNTLGGCLTWMFDKAQEYTFDYGNDIKAERKVLVAENLTLGQWQALQDFIGLGNVYRNSIVELTSSVRKLSASASSTFLIAAAIFSASSPPIAEFSSNLNPYS